MNHLDVLINGLKTQADFDAQAIDLIQVMSDKTKSNGDGYSINYFSDTNKLVLKNFKTDETWTHSFNPTVQAIDEDKAPRIYNDYFAKKLINIDDYPNIELNKNNFIIPIFDKTLTKVGEERIYLEISTNEFKKIKNGSVSENFYYYTLQKSISDCDIIVIAEGVANVLSFATFYKDKSYNMLFIATMSATNHLKALQSVLEILPTTKIVVNLVDNDQAGIQAHEQIQSHLSSNYILYFPIIPQCANEDFNDVVVKQTHKTLIDNFDNFIQNKGITFDTSTQNQLKRFLIDKIELLEEISSFIFKETEKYLLSYKYIVSSNDIYIISPNTMVYKLLDVQIIRQFVAKCIKYLDAHAFKFDSLVDNLITKIKAMAIATKFDLSINFKNGSIDLQNRKINKYYLPTVNYVDFHYYPEDKYNELFNNPENPVKKFLSTTLPDQEDYQMLCDCLGFLLTKNHQEKLIMFYGSGANGKSLLTDLIKHSLTDIVTDVSLDDCLKNENTRIRLENKLVALSSEFSGNLSNKELPIFKTLTSGQAISAKKLYQNQYVIENYAKFITSTNELMSTSTLNDSALLRRLAIIHFSQSFTPCENIKSTLLQPENLELFFNFLIRCSLNYKHEIKESTNSKQLLKQVHTSINNVVGFIEDQQLSSGESEIPSQIVYNKYKLFCQDNNLKALGINKFAEKMQQLNFTKKRKSSGMVYLLNINYYPF